MSTFPYSSDDVASRLYLLETLVADMHWCLVGQWRPQQLPLLDPGVFCEASNIDTISNSTTSHTSPSKRRRQRAKMMKQRMWTELKKANGAERQVNSADTSAQTSILDVADFTQIPAEAWAPIYDRFRVTTASGTSLTMMAAHRIKAKILSDETERLQELRVVIAKFIRESSATEQARRDIAAMTDAMRNATAVLEYARNLTVYAFFEECPLTTCRI